MYTIQQLYYLLQHLLLLGSAVLCRSAISGQYAYRNTVILENSKAIIGVLEDEEVVDAVYAFGIKHGLDASQRSNLMNNICTSANAVKCSRGYALLWSTPVTNGGVLVGTFMLYEGVEAVDAAHAFITQHNLPKGYRNAILREACEVVECHRTNPVLWRKKIDIEGNVVELVHKEGDEVADTIFSVLQPLGVPFSGRQQVMNEAKIDGVLSTRDFAKVFSKDISLESASFNGTFVAYDDGIEPVDKIYDFTRENGIEDAFDELSQLVLPQICQRLHCTYMTPITLSRWITGQDGNMIGNIEIRKDEEPADVVDRFVVRNELGEFYRNYILELICKDIICKRSRPVIFRKAINDENDRHLGYVEILEGDEVIDVVVRFLRKSKVPMDEMAVKNFFLQHACKYERLKCTRLIAHVFDNVIKDGNDTTIGSLIITEADEPADKIDIFCKEHNLNDEYYVALIDRVCEDDFVFCNRKSPIVFSVPLSGSDGNVIGTFEVQKHEEAVDALYDFFAFHGLFDKDWDFQVVVDQICNLQGVNCNRKDAIKFASDHFIMGGIDIGPIIIWDNQEIIDYLFQKRVEYNLTVQDQMVSYKDICSRNDVHCARSKAVIYELKDITKRDYAKFGNETCSRKYAGWQFLATWVDSSLGSKAASFVKRDIILTAIGHPLFCPIVLLAMFLSSFLFLRLPLLKKNAHVGHIIVWYGIVFLTVSLSQVTLIEPSNSIDQAMHIYEGKLPDIQVFEEEEPVDALLKWGKLAAKDHHPIVRETIYWDLIDKVCAEIKHGSCERKRAWEYIDMGIMTVESVRHEIDYYNPNVDPLGKLFCSQASDDKDPCILDRSKTICSRIHPTLPQCVEDIYSHISTQLAEYDSNRLDSKDTYRKLGIEMDAPDRELHPQLASIVRSHGMNLAPFSRVDNGTLSYPKWDIHTTSAYCAIDAFRKIDEPEKREWNDKPCTPYFGGSLCAKTDKDGNLMIEA